MSSGPISADDERTTQQGLPEQLESKVEALLTQREAISAFLDKREQELAAGEYERLYTRLREWAANRPDIFTALAFSMSGNERFLQDVEASFGDEAVSVLSRFQKSHAPLTPALIKVFNEHTHDLYNDDIVPKLTDVNSGTVDGIPTMHLEFSSA